MTGAGTVTVTGTGTVTAGTGIFTAIETGQTETHWTNSVMVYPNELYGDEEGVVDKSIVHRDFRVGCPSVVKGACRKVHVAARR